MKLQITPKVAKPTIAMLVEHLDATRVVAMRAGSESNLTIVFRENSPPDVYAESLSSWWASEFKNNKKYRSCLTIDDWEDITLLLTGSLK